MWIVVTFPLWLGGVFLILNALNILINYFWDIDEDRSFDKVMAFLQLIGAFAIFYLAYNLTI